MGIDDDMKAANDGISATAKMIDILKDSPQAKQAGENLGKAAVTLTRTLNVLLLPLAAVNFAYKRAEEYFTKGRFAEDLTEKTASIPPENIVEPRASVAGPALQGLAFSYDEPDLKELYLNLLASAMDSRVSERAHPAFVEIIRQLNSSEAGLFRLIAGAQQSLPIGQLRCEAADGKAFTLVCSHLLNFHNRDGSIELARREEMIDNFVRLGLVKITYDQHLSAEGQYDWIEKRPEYIIRNNEAVSRGLKILIDKGILKTTAFGVEFGKAIGLIPYNQ